VRRVLIANRGEIAVRIIRGCHELGIEAVAVYSDADVDALHVQLADRSVHIGPTPAGESYLSVEKIIAAAQSVEADAIHPGYGFLSERPELAEACVESGLVFIGPTANAMRALGDKASAKRLAAAADVPTVPSWGTHSVPEDAFPVLVKAAAGGGGRGMRIVETAADLPDALTSAEREAVAGFGSSELLVERLVRNARHVEVQILADQHGHVVDIGDRDCSLQRRHQKVVEEAPAPELSAETHAALAEAAVSLAREAGYTNAGTAEFLVAPDGAFYFLELNARLQVEHPVTELAFGIDLVQWQLRIARGDTLDLAEESVEAGAHSIEVRLYAEDPVSFLPTGGRVLQVKFPAGVRIDHALREGTEVSLAYDPLLAKIIASGATREEARLRLIAALRSLVVLGTITNQPLLLHALELEQFARCEHSTSTLEQCPVDPTDLTVPNSVIDAARARLDGAAGPYAELARWGRPTAPTAPTMEFAVCGWGDSLWVSHQGVTTEAPRDHIDVAAATNVSAEQDGNVRLTSPMPGTVIAAKTSGDKVRVGEAVVVIEAMKMENAIAAPFDGVVERVTCAVGDMVQKGAELAEVAR
jgi:acetyl/propionyl-CoA carboxylase alpha subunit